MKKSIFADDSSFWMSGKSIGKITKHLQKAMIKIEKWSSYWGFSLSKEKTVGVVFCLHRKLDKTEILMNNTSKVKSCRNLSTSGGGSEYRHTSRTPYVVTNANTMGTRPSHANNKRSAQYVPASVMPRNVKGWRGAGNQISTKRYQMS